MSRTNTLVTQALGYFSGQFLVVLAGFISFPILTRILTVSDYGVLSYVSSLMVLMAAFSKMGLQHSAVRFYPEFRLKKMPYPITQFYSTLYFAPIVLGTTVTCIVIATIVTGNSIFDEPLSAFVVFAAISIPLVSAVSTFSQFLRAEQRISFFNLLTLTDRYGSLFLGITMILLVTRDLWGLYYGGLICRAALFLYVTSYLYIKNHLSVKRISLGFFKSAIAYGAPMFGYEFCAQIMEYGDRLLLKHFIGIKAVAIYSVGYNPAMYISQLFGTSLRLAILPIYLDIWATKGKKATQEFLSRVLSYFALIAIPIIFGVCAVKKEMITLLASDKYASSHHIVPYIIIGTMLYASNAFLTAGLLIYKRTYLLTASLVAGTILNICLNLLLIPRMGALGAAMSTLIAYLFVIFLNAWLSFRHLAFSIDYKGVLAALLASGGMFLFVKQIDLGTVAYDLVGKIIAGVLSYGCLLILLHKRTRSDFAFQFRKLSQRFLQALG